MQVSDLRGILTYVPRFREKVFVLALDGGIIAQENFSNILLDLAVLHSLNIRVGGLDPTELREACEKYRYQKVLIFDSLPFLQDHARTETPETIQFLDRQLEADYRSLGYDVLRVPVMPIEDRVQFVTTNLKLNSKTPFRKSIPLDSFFETGKPIRDIQSLFL